MLNKRNLSIAVAMLLVGISASASAQTTTTPTTTSPSTTNSTRSPVVRAEAGNWGMGFRFGGLAPMTLGTTTRTAGSTVFGQLSVRKVFSEEWVLPVYFGTGLHLDAPDAGSTATSFGMEAGVGIEYHFRIWRRISPFIGGGFGLGYLNPTGSNSFLVGIGLGPTAGIEYYLADRLSVIAQYMFTMQFVVSEGYGGSPGSNFTFAFNTMAGGALTLVFYF